MSCVVPRFAMTFSGATTVTTLLSELRVVCACKANRIPGSRMRPRTNARSGAILKQLVNLVFIIALADQADVLIHDAAILIEYEGGRQRLHSSVCLRDFVVSDQHSVVHLVFSQPGLYCVPTLVVHRDAHDGEPAVLVFL